MTFKRNWMFLLAGAFAMILLVGCNFSSGGGSSETLATHDIELPAGLDSKLPLPKGSEIKLNISEDDHYGIMFVPGTTYPKSIEFFSETFASSGWEVERENIPEETEGERTAYWTLWADGYAVDLTLTAFGDKDGFNMSGMYSITEQDENMKGVDRTHRDGNVGLITLNGENLPVPENLPSDIPIMDGADIRRIQTFDEETLPHGHGHTHIGYFYEGDYEDVYDFYMTHLPDNGYIIEEDEEEDDNQNTEVYPSLGGGSKREETDEPPHQRSETIARKGKEEVEISIGTFPADPTIIDVSIYYFDIGREAYRDKIRPD